MFIFLKDFCIESLEDSIFTGGGGVGGKAGVSFRTFFSHFIIYIWMPHSLDVLTVYIE